jgi:hypothetical protein
LQTYGKPGTHQARDLSPVSATGPTAEREGFEPSDPVSQVNSLAVSPIRPLSHLSKGLEPITRQIFRVPGTERVGSVDRRRPKGSGSIQQIAPAKYRLRVFVGTGPVTGSPRQISGRRAPG